MSLSDLIINAAKSSLASQATPAAAPSSGESTSIQDKLTQQILGQGTTSKWTGEGYGSPTANAKMMAAILAAAGIKDIREFGKLDQVILQTGQLVTLKDPNDPSKGGYVVEKFIEQPNGEFVAGRTIELTPERLAKMQPWYVHDDQTGGGPVLRGYTVQDVPYVRETFGNKLTGTPIQSNYGYRGGNIFAGTTTGEDQTGFGVQFAKDGTPYFFTQKGKSTTSWGLSPEELLPLASFALNTVAPGAGKAIGTALGVPATAAAAVGNAIISGTMAELGGGDFIKGAVASGVNSVLSGGVIPSTGSAIADQAIAGGVRAALTGGDIGSAVLSGAASGAVSTLAPPTGNAIADRAVASGIRAALAGGNVENAILSGAMSGFGAEAKKASAREAGGEDALDFEAGGGGQDGDAEPSLADLLGDVEIDDRTDINDLIQSGNDYTAGADTQPSAQVDDFARFPETTAPTDTGGSLADIIGDVSTDTRDDINQNIESGNGYIDDFGGFPETTAPTDTGGSLADVTQDLEVDDRKDINELIESGNGYTSVSGGSSGGSGGSRSTATSTPTPVTPVTAGGAKPDSSGGLDLGALLALLGGGGQQPAKEEKATPEEEVTPFDWTKPLQTDPFAARSPTPTMAAGGSIDELLALLQHRG